MRVLVVGASRGVGLFATQLLCARGHEVTALSRQPVRAEPAPGSLEWREGDATDPAKVAAALDRQDAVILAIGSKRVDGTGSAPLDVCSRATEVLVPAMEQAGRPRLIVISSFGVGETRNKLPWVMWPLYRTVLKSRLDDKELQEKRVRDSTLPWIFLHPFVLSDALPREDVFASIEGKTRRYRIARADVASFAVGQVASDAYLGKTVTLSG
jgi:nucleoside-diphosphate-sugar epimerase